MNRLSFFAIVLIVALLLGPSLGQVLAQEGDPVELVPFTDHNMGVSGVAPAGWTQVAVGAYQRLASQNDLTAIIQQAALGVSTDTILAGLLPRLGQAALPDNEQAYETEYLTWNVYQIEVEAPGLGTVFVDLALVDTPFAGHIILLQSMAEDYESLHESVFMPVLEAYAPFSLNWGHDEPLAFEPEMEPAQLVPEVLSVRDHDTSAYTQGLLLHDGSLYESAGLYGESTLREVDPETGEVLRSVPVAEEYFAEGLERVDDRLIQLTWKENVAFVYDLETFEQVDTYTYDGEGWGLCSDGEYLYMSNGSPFIILRDPETFEVIDYGLVTVMGRPAENLNELECVGDYIYANIYTLDYIVQIDKRNGNVVGLIDAAGLLEPEQEAALSSGEVLNGIVYLPEDDTFLITGKHWPSMFEVRFVEAEETSE